MIIENDKTILIVEDSVTIAMAETNKLRKLGYEVLVAISGKEAVALYMLYII